MTPSNCPHANHFGTTLPHPELRQVCSVCGAPRVQSGAPTRGGEVEALRAAKDAYTRRTSWRFGAGCSGALASLGAILGLALLRLDSGWATTTAFAFFTLAVPFALVLVTGIFRSKAYSKELRASLDAAWARAVREIVLGSPRPLSASALGQLLGVREDDADRWLMELSVEGLVRSEITEDGQVVYTPAPRLRVDGGVSDAEPKRASEDLDLGSDASLEARFAELAKRESSTKQ